MKLSFKSNVVLGALAFAAVIGAASAQTFKNNCYPTGTSQLEQIGDRPNHAIQVNNFTCRFEGGILDGAVNTGINVYEWDGPRAITLSGSSVIRKPGGTLVTEVTGSVFTLQMAEGKMTGGTNVGKGVVKLATGTLSSLKGKTYSFVATVVPGTGQWTSEVKYD